MYKGKQGQEKEARSSELILNVVAAVVFLPVIYLYERYARHYFGEIREISSYLLTGFLITKLFCAVALSSASILATISWTRLLWQREWEERFRVVYLVAVHGLLMAALMFSHAAGEASFHCGLSGATLIASGVLYAGERRLQQGIGRTDPGKILLGLFPVPFLLEICRVQIKTYNW